MEEIIRTEKDRVLNVLRRGIRQDRVHVSAQNGSVLQNVDAGAAQTKTQKLWRPIVDAAKEKKSSDYISCRDEVGQRKTKCPCFIQGSSCNKKCRCFNCGNGFGKKDCLTPVKRRAKKITSSSPSAKRKRGYDYLK